MREFEQMEMQFFVRPGEEINYYNFWKDQRLKWHLTLALTMICLDFIITKI